MKKSLSHLPREKRAEIRAVVEIINEMMDVEFIILFGSYAHGNWVEDVYTGDDGTTYEYQSDHDILVVVEDLPKYEYKGFRRKIRKKARRSADVDTQLSIIMHSVEEVKAAIKNGNYFFADIKKEGIQLYSYKRFRLLAIKELNTKQRRIKAETNFKNWFESAKVFLNLTDAVENRPSFRYHYR